MAGAVVPTARRTVAPEKLASPGLTQVRCTVLFVEVAVRVVTGPGAVGGGVVVRVSSVSVVVCSPMMLIGVAVDSVPCCRYQ